MRKGFTLIELLAVIVILAVIALIATPIILGIISDAKKSAFKDTAYGITDAAKGEYIKEMYKDQNPVDIIFTYTSGVESSSVSGKSLNYSGSKPSNGAVSLKKDGDVAIAIHDGTYCAYKGFNDNEITIEVKTWTECEAILNGLIVIDIDYDAAKGVNKPRLATGMVPIKWNGSAWVDTTENDTAWYNYTNTDKQWANARTADGSMWVWIPRYAYQIATNYHTNTVGTINVKFLKNDSNIASDNTAAETSPTYSGSAQTNYIKHPAFTFGTTELTGMWIAKFEMSGTTSALNSMPGVASLRNTTLGNMFTASRNMETKNIYGWGLASGLNADGTFTTNTNNVDTHMMKSREWGAVAYLSLSTYGKNAEITINNSSSYYTGGGTGNAYVTNVNQSTTGNIYGVYDMSGGAYEYTMGNYNNTAGSSGLTPSSINDKYIDRYPTTGAGYTASIYGDAAYETSSSTSSPYANSWYGDYAYSMDSGNPWILHGGCYGSGSAAGVFYFTGISGISADTGSWRTVVLVGTDF